jgi:formylglycine-generating enzyme required for sulfatase activity
MLRNAVIFTLIFVMGLLIPGGLLAAKVCPKCGETYPDSYNFCPKTSHGQPVKLVKRNRTASMASSPEPPPALEPETEAVSRPLPANPLAKDFVMVAVNGGCFQMGDHNGDGDSDEKPVHEVCVDDFSIGRFEVTQGEWKKIMDNNPSHFSSCGDNCPVENVSFNDVQEFLSRLNHRTGKQYRLPTEAEWEYAARSGGKNEKYSGSEYSPDLVAWSLTNSDKKSHPVGRKQANTLGIYDMSGNVWEWVSDWYAGDYYGKSARQNPNGPSNGANRVIRGGSWGSIDSNLRVSDRRNGPNERSISVGFRVALSADQAR